MKKIVLKFIALGVIAMISVVGFVGCGKGKESSDISDVSVEVSDVSETSGVSGESEASGTSVAVNSTTGNSVAGNSTASTPVANDPTANKAIAGKYAFQITEAMKSEFSANMGHLTQDQQNKFLEAIKQVYYQMNSDGTFVYHITALEEMEEAYASGKYNFVDIKGTYVLKGSALTITYNEADMRKATNIGKEEFDSMKNEILIREYTFDEKSKTISSSNEEQYKKVS